MKQKTKSKKVETPKISVKSKKITKGLIEKFLESDSISATAGKFLLATLAMGGIVLAGAALPGLVSLMGEHKKSKKYSKKQIQYALDNLKRRKLIEIVQMGDDKIKVKLTNKGKERIKEFSFAALTIRKPIRWDKKWRILIFDIPTKPKIYDKAREALRKKIKDLGFYQMQKSVWVYPYECEDEILLIAELYHVQKYIEIITAGKILHENLVRNKFKL